MYIAMFGCDLYPAGYDMVSRGIHCEQPVAAGWMGAFLLLFIIIFGAYVLPTVLIGIVSISFEEATRRSQNLEEMYAKMEKVTGSTSAAVPPPPTTLPPPFQPPGAVSGGYP